MSRYGAQKTDENDKRVLATRNGLGFYEEEYMDSAGNVRQWLVNKLPLLDAEGEIESIVTVALDIGERKRGDLRRSRLTDFLETSRDASSQLVANLNRAAELIQSFKQVAADRNYSDQRSFDLGDLTEQVVMSLRPGLRKHHLTLNVDCQPNLTMNSYPGPYGQVLTNLFLNSVAHAFPDGRPGAVDIVVRESGKDNVEIVFSDNGCGMSLDVRRRAFDPFFTTRRDQGGTGLGLHIVYSIVTNRLGGRLDLDSEPGGGTRIQIILPRIAPLELAAE